MKIKLKRLTSNAITFPRDFEKKDKNYCKELSQDEIQLLVNHVKYELSDKKNGAFAYSTMGNVMVIGINNDDEKTIIVAKNFYEFNEYK